MAALRRALLALVVALAYVCSVVADDGKFGSLTLCPSGTCFNSSFHNVLPTLVFNQLWRYDLLKKNALMKLIIELVFFRRSLVHDGLELGLRDEAP